MAEYPSFRSEAFAADRLIGGDAKLVTETVTIAAGANLTRGALLGQITATKKWVLSLAAAGDGSQTPKAILVDDAAAASADVTAGVYRAGEFNENALILGTGHTLASIHEGLAALNIYLKTPVPA